MVKVNKKKTEQKINFFIKNLQSKHFEIVKPEFKKLKEKGWSEIS